MRTKLFWIPGPWSGRLAIVPRPRGGDWLDDEIRAWRDAGVDLVVSLLEPREESELLLQRESASSLANGLKFVSYPIADRGVPESKVSAAELAQEIVRILAGGANVAIHCRQGIGRSSVIAAAVLVSAGVDPAQALVAIEGSRGVEVPETEQQRRWIEDFASGLPVSPGA